MIDGKIFLKSLAVLIESVDSLYSSFNSEFRAHMASEMLFASVSVSNYSYSVVIAHLESRAVLANEIGFFMTCAHDRMAEAVEHNFSVLLRSFEILPACIEGHVVSVCLGAYQLLDLLTEELLFCSENVLFADLMTCIVRESHTLTAYL